MMRLPPLLQPWAEWLTLFPQDLVDPIGELLLRLNPVLGPLKRHAAPAAVDPAGVGDIVQRGSYDRLLISEWAYADAVPDEFIRRAANGELLFTGPEPTNSDMALCSVALFDAGPYQLGEPRLVHVAMFILLARRAALAGAEFKWGILQRPDILFSVQGKDAIEHLLNVRTFGALDEAGIAAWQPCLEAVADCWLVGDERSPRPPQARALVTVRRGWLSEQLEVTLAQRRGSSTVALNLPPPADGVRLLRKPFEALAKAAAAGIPAAGAHSLKQPPYFSTYRQWLAVRMVDGAVSLYHVPDSVNAQAGRPRRSHGSQFSQATVAAGAIGKNMGSISRHGEQLYFSSFPGKFFSQGYPTAPVALTEQVKLVPGVARLAQVFFLQQRIDSSKIAEQVLVLDTQGSLVGWKRSGKPTQTIPPATASLVASGVIGAFQLKERLLFAITASDRTDIYQLSCADESKKHLFPLMHKGSKFFFGNVERWRGGGGLYALQLEGDLWLVGDNSGGAHVKVAAGHEVLGVGFSDALRLRGLLALNPARTRIELHCEAKRHTVVESTEKIAQASYDPVRNRLAWLGHQSGALTVRGLDQEKPFLRTIPAGEQYDG
jgi:hypothetical protein